MLKMLKCFWGSWADIGALNIPECEFTSFSFIEAIWNVTHKHDAVFLTIMWNMTQAHTHYFPITFLHCFTDPTRESFKFTECVCIRVCQWWCSGKYKVYVREKKRAGELSRGQTSCSWRHIYVVLKCLSAMPHILYLTAFHTVASL